MVESWNFKPGYHKHLKDNQQGIIFQVYFKSWPYLQVQYIRSYKWYIDSASYVSEWVMYWTLFESLKL